MKEFMSDPGKNVLVVAHPDDEVLWFSSIIPYIDKVVIIYSGVADDRHFGHRRSQVLLDLQYPTTCFQLEEPGTYSIGDWQDPLPTWYGMKLFRHNGISLSENLYRNGFHVIRQLLIDTLSSYSCIFTHNPWGEYGHPDHVQVYRIIESLKGYYGFEIYVPGYVSARSLGFAQQYALSGDNSLVVCRTDSDLAKKAAASYKDHQCWTWIDDWTCDHHELFLLNPFISTVDAFGKSVVKMGILRHLMNS